MENVLPRIGTMPNRFWPTPTDGGHAAHVHTRDENLKVVLEVFSTASRAPLHINTNFDKFIYLAEGGIRIISPKFCNELKPGDGIIVRANHPHGFLVHESGAKLVHISIGNNVYGNMGHQLPQNIQNQLAPIANNLNAVKSFQLETKWKDLYSQFEIQTMQWAKDEILKSLESGTKSPFEFEAHKEKVQQMQGWRLPNAYILKVKGFAIGFRHNNDSGCEYIKVNRIFAFGFGLNRSDRKVQVLK